MQVITSAKVY